MFDGLGGSAAPAASGSTTAEDDWRALLAYDASSRSAAGDPVPLPPPDDDQVAGIRNLAGGPELAAWVASVDPRALGAPDLVELVAAFERVASWARARSAEAAAALAEQPQMTPRAPTSRDLTGRRSVLAEVCGAATEVSLRLGVTRRAALRLVHSGRLLAGTLQRTGSALERGEVGWHQASVLVEGLGAVPWEVAHAVEDVVLPGAGVRTPTQLRSDVARALCEVDPDDAQERNRRAARGRKVDRPRMLPDGMAYVRAVLPAESAIRLDATLQGAAVAARGAGDVRTVDQLRADALDAMAGAAWASGWIGAAPAAGGAARGGSGTDDATLTPGDQRAGSDVRPSVSGGHPMRVGRVAGRRAQVQVTVGIGTLLGLDDRPAELAGYGPIGADVARRIAVDGTWRRLLTDPVSGAVVDLGRTRYRPPEDLKETVRARDRHCVVPTCAVAAAACDLDHTVPFDQGGTTSADNLGALCRVHHGEKTAGVLRLGQPDPGVFAIRTPAGRIVHAVPPRPPGVPWSAEETGRRTGERGSEGTGRRTGERGGAPPRAGSDESGHRGCAPPPF